MTEQHVLDMLATAPREPIQALWAGQGELFRTRIDGAPLVVKWARPTAKKRGSYVNEIAFYRELAPHCRARVARLYAAREADDTILVMEDLDAEYPVRVDEASPRQLDTALAWLGSFHAQHLGVAWQPGTYWHLDARRDELAAIADRALREAAPAIAGRLASATFQTIVHGDPKEANFCFTPDGTRCAAVDFQYVGRGCGMVDVAYLLHGHRDEDARLATYFAELRRALAPEVDAAALEAEWRALYPVAQLDFARFLAGWRR